MHHERAQRVTHSLEALRIDYGSGTEMRAEGRQEWLRIHFSLSGGGGRAPSASILNYKKAYKPIYNLKLTQVLLGRLTTELIIVLSNARVHIVFAARVRVLEVCQALHCS